MEKAFLVTFFVTFFGTELAVSDLVERLFQGQLVLRTRCLECECFTERREDFQDISVPVQRDEHPTVEESSESKYTQRVLAGLWVKGSNIYLPERVSTLSQSNFATGVYHFFLTCILDCTFTTGVEKIKIKSVVILN